MDLAVGRPETESVAAFEKHWRSLARGNIVPTLSDFSITPTRRVCLGPSSPMLRPIR